MGYKPLYRAGCSGFLRDLRKSYPLSLATLAIVSNRLYTD